MLSKPLYSLALYLIKEVVKRGHSATNKDKDLVIVFSAKEKINLKGFNFVFYKGQVSFLEG